MKFFKQKGTDNVVKLNEDEIRALDQVNKLSEDEIRALDQVNIFTHDVYHGVDRPPYNLSIRTLKEQGNLDDILPAVQARAEHDGEWCIKMGFVGKNNKNEPKMRQMMAYVGNPINIWKSIEAILDEQDFQGSPIDRTVDFLCRDLANASKWAANQSSEDGVA